MLLPTLTNEQILRMAPVVGAQAPKHDVSQKYTFIPTLSLINCLRKEGWQPVIAQQMASRENNGFQRHMVKFIHPEIKIGNDETVQAILVNSHDRSCHFKFFTGVFRFVCMNGLVVGDTFGKIEVKHINSDPREIVDASFEVLESIPHVAGKIDSMKAITLTDAERNIFAKAALQINYKEGEEPFISETLLTTRRYEDNQKTLWHTFNTVQENMVRGGITGRSKNGMRRIRTKPVKSIDADLRINRALWTLAEEMAKIKAA